ncbi:MAG: FAD-dependent oxidoreductase [Gammaproteobacteria bacterium]|jgi:NADPH-dependent glutamate synthase beta subunit-like oxidoreductase
MGVKMTRGAYALPGTSLDYRTGTWRIQRPLHRHAPAPCHHACPAGEDAQQYLALVENEHYREAWETIVGVNPLPAVTGRVCHHPCEAACNRGQYDEPIAIHNVERFLGDRALAEGWDYPAAPSPEQAQAVAVIGSGPAGCSAAYHLNRLGYRAHLYEALPMAGGLLQSALPPYRLPRDILNAELERLLATGIEFLPGKRLGRDFSLSELQSEYPAVFLAPGTQRGRQWDSGGATPRDLHVGLDLLKQWIAVGSIQTWSSAAIVGGGNTAIDLARILKHAGVNEVHVITHQSLPGPGKAPSDVMPAIAREISQALEEGVRIHEHRGVQRLVLRGEQVVGVELVHMKGLPDGHNGLRRTTFEGTETLLHVDQVIPAIGQVVDPAGLESLLDHKPFLAADYNGRVAGHAHLFTGGDTRGDHGTVSEAIGDGRRAAEAIACMLQQREEPVASREQPVSLEQLNLNYYEHAPRPEAPVLPVSQRTGSAEVEGGLERQQVQAEGHRCLSCGNCLSCDNCWTLCPDVAVLKTAAVAADGSHYVFDYDYCKGCGLCARECPSGYIIMQPEE